MPNPTPELGLQQAVNSDDTADYLTLDLAPSLVTLDSLFNNVTGHTHGGVHQGGPINTIPPSAIPDGSITSAKITDGTIATVDLANGCVTAAQLATGSVTSPAIAASVTLTTPTLNGATLTSPAITSATVSNVTLNGTITSSAVWQQGPETVDWFRNETTGNGIFNDAVGVGVGFDAGGPYVYGGYAGGHLITESAAQTLSNKTLTSPTLTSPTISGATLTNNPSMPYGTFLEWGNTVNHSIYCDANLMQFAHTAAWRFNNTALGRSVDVGVVALTNGGTSLQVNTSLNVNTGYGLVVGGNNLNGQSFFCNGGAGGVGGWQVISARRYKHDVAQIADPLAIVTNPAIHGYHYLLEAPGADGTAQYGFIGEEWAGAAPEVLSLDGNRVRLMDYGQVTPIIFEALKAYVAQTEARLAVLEGRS